MAENTSINDFIQHFATDFARSNLFQVSFDGVQFKTSSANEHLTMACKGIQVPGVTFIEGKYMFNGFNRKSAIGADFDPIALTFLVDGSGKTLEIFEEWSNRIFDKQTGKFGFKEDYQTDLTIMLMDRTGKVYDNIKVFEAYPTNIDAVDISWDSADTIIELTVSFNFLKVISKFDGSVAKLNTPKKFDGSSFHSPLSIVQSSTFPDVVNKIPLDIKIPKSLNDIVSKAPLDINIPDTLSDVANRIPLNIEVPTQYKDVANKASAVDDMIKKAKSLF